MPSALTHNPEQVQRPNRRRLPRWPLVAALALVVLAGAALIWTALQPSAAELARREAQRQADNLRAELLATPIPGRNPANADFAGNHRRERVDDFTAQVCLHHANAQRNSPPGGRREPKQLDYE
jgi:hypothetical protein